jgi:phytoene dehydrogenase-like protein
LIFKILLARGALVIQPSRSYDERAWDDAKHGRLPRSPFMALVVPSAWDETLAPAGHQTMEETSVESLVLFCSTPVALVRLLRHLCVSCSFGESVRS